MFRLCVCVRERGLFSCEFLARLQQLCLHGSQCLLSAQASWLCQVRITASGCKRIFFFCVCVCVCVQDYVDCFQKLIKLHLSDVQEREIVYVLLDCCLQENVFNKYYTYLAQKLCEFKKSNQVCEFISDARRWG